MRLRHIASVGLISLLAACGGSNDSPTAQPTPAPTPAPTATPTPVPTATPAPVGCMVNPNPECGGPEGPPGVFGCCREAATDLFGFEVVDAIAIVQRDRPDLFQGAEGRVSDVPGLTRAICEAIEANFPLCCEPGRPEDEIAVKANNSLSEQYDVVFGTGFVRPNGYTVTCQPARF